MSKMSFLIKPYPDELFYSWIHRLAKLNALSIPIFSDSYLGRCNARIGELALDAQSSFTSFYQSINTPLSPSKLFLLCSTFGFESIFMPDSQQSRYISNTFYLKDKLNPSVNKLFNKARICPVCLQEDIEATGEPYLHRAHHLSGVKVCHKHNIGLLDYQGQPGHECEYIIENYQPISSDINIESLSAYADYANALFTSGITTNIQLVKNALYTALRKRGYGVSDGYTSFDNDISAWPYNDLIHIDTKHFLKYKMMQPNYVNTVELLPILMFIFPNADDFVTAVQKTTILLDYKCPTCQHTYCTTPYAQKCNFGCPQCDAKISVGARFARTVDAIAPHYVPQGEFIGMDEKMLFLHQDCKKVVRIKPRALIFEGTRCACETTITYAQAQKAIDSLSDYELVAFTKAEDYATFFCKKCGHTFTCLYRKFMVSPGCRICKPKSMTPELFEERVKILGNGEYEVAGEFVDQRTKVAIRHLICGEVQLYKPSRFLEGKRCQHCANQRIYTQPELFEENNTTQSTMIWLEWYELACQYYNEFGNLDLPKRDSYNGKALGLWLQKQRDARDGNRGLIAERIEKLDALHFKWDPLQAEWDRRYAQYCRFVEGNGGKPYISRRTDFEGEHLGAWVETQRKWYNAGNLSDERLEKMRKLNKDFPKNTASVVT